jgi:hypothetical protein
MGKKDVKQQQPQMPKVQAPARPPKVSFDAWWAVTAKKIPTQHHKEVVMADFKARGLSKNETMDAYNKALKQYGVKLG